MMNSKDRDGIMGVMSKMMGGDMGMDMLNDNELMMEMMPQGLNMMLSRLPKEKRVNVVLNLIQKLVEQAGADLSEEEKKNFIDNLVKKIKTEKEKTEE